MLNVSANEYRKNQANKELQEQSQLRRNEKQIADTKRKMAKKSPEEIEKELKKKLTPIVTKINTQEKLDLNKNGIDDLVDDLVKKAGEIEGADGLAKAINFFVNGYNKLRFKKKATNQAMANERHQPLKMPHGGLEVARFSGPGTMILKRIQESLKKHGKVVGFTPVDTVAAKHDVQYALSKNTDDIRKADNEMKRRIKNIMKKGLDSKYNAVGGIAIAAKTTLEDLKLLSKDKFASFKKLDPKEKALLEKVLEQLEKDQEQQGWGNVLKKISDKISDKKIKRKVINAANTEAQKRIIRNTPIKDIKKTLEIMREEKSQKQKGKGGGQSKNKSSIDYNYNPYPRRNILGMTEEEMARSRIKRIKENEAKAAAKAAKKAEKEAAKGKQSAEGYHGKGKRKPTAWNKHVMKVHKANPSLSFKEVLIKAKKTY
jgi:hypothetical protein